jgi:hypothetical protein
MGAGGGTGPGIGCWPTPDQVGRRRRGRVGGHRGRQRDRGASARRRHQAQAGSGGARGGSSHTQDEALGHSRGGLTTKLHLAVDGRGRPPAVTLTAGRRHERTQLQPLLYAMGVPRPGGHGRPRKRPAQLLADGGYSDPICRRLLGRRGIGHTIPTRVDQRGRPGRPPGLTRSATGDATWSSGA